MLDLALLATAILFIVKVTGMAALSWGMVFLPIAAVALVFLVVVVVVALGYLIGLLR